MNNDKIDINVRVRFALPKDVGAITEMFWDHLTSNPEYISHGEMQMGVALTPDTLALDGRRIWESYLSRHIASDDSIVLAAYSSDGIVGFAIVQVAEDEGRRFGVLNDVLVKRDYRGFGFGRELLEASFGGLQGLGVGSCYLESGRGNHNAHGFFEKYGFRLISHTFGKSINQKPGANNPG